MIDLKNRRIIVSRLLDYGFQISDSTYFYEKTLTDTNFKVIVTYSDETLSSKVIDMESSEDYVLVDIKTPIGRYAAELKMEYEDILEDIVEKCSISDIFTSPQSKRLMNYVKDKYSSELEFLWKKFPNNAIYRNNGNNKWFAILAVVKSSKIGIGSDREIEILIIKHPSEKIPEIIDNMTVFKGYHMNKKYWITIPLDDRITDDELFLFLDISYDIVKIK